MKKKFLFSVLAVMAMMTMCVFTACGGDDKDDDLPDGYQKTTEGVHRMEVSVDGDLTGWNGKFAFVAVCGDGTRGFVKLYENGRQISDDGTFLGEELRDYIIETDSKCDQMTLTATLSHGTSASVSPVTVTLKSYINGQPKKAKTVEVTDSYKTIVFNAELDADKY
jgi:hypothetical protein